MMEKITPPPVKESTILWQGDFDGGTTLIVYLHPLYHHQIFWSLHDPSLLLPIDGVITILVPNAHITIDELLDNIRRQQLDYNIEMKHELISSGVTKLQ